eukprot:g32822.t2
MQQVMREESFIDDRDAQLQRSFEVSTRDLREAREEVVPDIFLVDDDLFGPLTSTASGLLAGLDIAIAGQAILLAVLLTAQKGFTAEDTSDAASQSSSSAASQAASDEQAGGGASTGVETTAAAEVSSGKVVLRFYGRWDNEDQWVLLQSLPLHGFAGSVVDGLRRSKSFLGPLASKLLTALVARSARGLVQRRGWKPIVEKTMAEVGREFYLGYLVEPPVGRFGRSESKPRRSRYLEATIPELYTDPRIRFNRQVKDWGVEYTIDVGDEEEWRDILPKMPELANFQLPDHMLNNSRRQLEDGRWWRSTVPEHRPEVPVQERYRIPDENTNKEYAKFMKKVRDFQADEEAKKEKGEKVACLALRSPSKGAELSGGFFDYDELDKAYDALTANDKGTSTGARPKRVFPQHPAPAGGLPLLRPNAVKRLRKAHEEAVSLASQDMEFRLDIFESEYQKGVDAVNSEQGFLAQARMLLQKSEMAAMQGSKRYQARLGVKKDSVQRWIEGIKERILPNQADATEVVSKALELLKKEENMVKLQVQVGCTVHLDPSPRNQYLFNGDFVDRGQFSVEVAFLLLALKVLYPRSVHLNRGNHEALRMNALYGFQHETENKYGNELFRLFSEAFKHLPLCTLVNSAVFVVHGGLSSKEGVKLSASHRLGLQDLLWSDPMDSPGFCTSPRGGGILFGPDVTKRFCEENGLCCIIRSHEMKSEGYEWQHMNRCLTIFSAPNYCDVCGNLGAVCSITPSQARTVRLQDLNCHVTATRLFSGLRDEVDGPMRCALVWLCFTVCSTTVAQPGYWEALYAESTRLNATDAQTGKRAPRVTVCFDGTTKPGSTLLDGGPNEQPPNQVGTCDTRLVRELVFQWAWQPPTSDKEHDCRTKCRKILIPAWQCDPILALGGDMDSARKKTLEQREAPRFGI